MQLHGVDDLKLIPGKDVVAYCVAYGAIEDALDLLEPPSHNLEEAVDHFNDCVSMPHQEHIRRFRFISDFTAERIAAVGVSPARSVEIAVLATVDYYEFTHRPLPPDVKLG